VSSAISMRRSSLVSKLRALPDGATSDDDSAFSFRAALI
jgi:hypothetical protein